MSWHRASDMPIAEIAIFFSDSSSKFYMNCYVYTDKHIIKWEEKDQSSTAQSLKWHFTF